MPKSRGKRQFERGAVVLVGEGDPAVAVFAEDVLRQGLHERLIQGLGVAKALLDALALQDLADLAADCLHHGQ